MTVSLSEKRAHRLSTPFIRVPIMDWSEIRCGVKREFRMSSSSSLYVLNYTTPLLVIAFVTSPAGLRHEQLMILEEAWSEPLHAMSDASLEAEGFASRRAFKQYWRARHGKKGWRGIAHVTVMRMRPLEDGDLEDQRERLFRHIYGTWLPE